MSIGLPSPQIADTQIRQNFARIADLFPLASIHQAYPVVTSLPATGTNGQVVHYLADSTNGVVWQFKYRSGSSSSYKWEFVGGPPLFAEVNATESTTSASYVALTTAGPSVALPLPGDYMVSIGMKADGNSGTNRMSYDIGGTAAVDADSVNMAESAGFNNSAHRSRRKTGLTAVTLTAKYKSGGGTCNFSDRCMEVLPVRVSA